MRRSLFALSVLALFVGSVIGDCYMDNPRGSNDRLNEANTNRNNANRLFDSQNNAKGGYCWGPAMTYYEGSQLTVEWTSQHGCGNAKLYCNVVIQYMCSAADADPLERVRDGTTTNTIPDNEAGAAQVDENGELEFGMHESYASYQACKTRNRNTGLFIADREEEGGLTEGDASAIYTRQNNNGNRHGYECPEERDYYPYWAPAQWRDVAILTQDTEYCGFYETNSQNVAETARCVDANGDLLAPITKEECGTITGSSWQVVPSHGIPAPECVLAPWSRDNHLGNGIDGYANTYNWTIPPAAELPCTAAGAAGCNCVLRMRYNISTTDLDLTADDPANQIDGNNPIGDVQSGPFLDWKYNAAASPFFDDQIVEGSGMTMQLALDTSQFGRTFQDRSHVFHIASRDGTNIPAGARVFNLNVRGKRGNIVQTYPAKEYDFVPEILYTRTGDYVHFQWTGCDTNPAGNAGEGTDQTDRSNIVQIAEIGANLPASDKWIEANTPLFEDPALRKRMAFLDQDPAVCLTQAELLAKNNNNENNAKQDVQNCMKLNAAETPYFDGGVVQMNRTADDTPLMYMSSRNNNFSNRGQKAVIYVQNVLPTWAIVLTAIGGGLFLASAGLVGAAFYAKSHPHSGIANIFNKM